MSTKGASWQHPASAAPQYTPSRPDKFMLQEGLDNNWVFFPEPRFVSIEDEEDEEEQEQSSRRGSVNSVTEGQKGRPGMPQRGDSWVGGWWGKIFKSKL